MIEFESVSKSYPGGAQAVNNFSLVVPSHRTVVLVGSSGSGKTTLLRMVNRMVDPTSGRVLIDSDHRGFIEDDAAAPDVNQRVSGPQINGEIIGKLAAQPFEHVVESTGLSKTVNASKQGG